MSATIQRPKYFERLAPEEVPEGECRVVWAGGKPPDFRYVRERLVTRSRRAGKIQEMGFAGLIVGWTELSPDAEPVAKHEFIRRLFLVRVDIDPYPFDGAPFEAVDPLTVEPGKPGRITDRAWFVTGDASKPTPRKPDQK